MYGGGACNKFFDWTIRLDSCLSDYPVLTLLVYYEFRKPLTAFCKAYKYTARICVQGVPDLLDKRDGLCFFRYF